MSFEHCRVELGPGAARLTLARPPVNVLHIPMLEEMHRALDAVSSDARASILVLDAEGDKAFCAGVEVRDHFAERLDEMLDTFHGFCARLLDFDAITVALIHADALGGGMELASCCDFVVAAEEARFAQPEIDLACFPPLGAALYPSLFGAKRAAEVVLLGKRYSANEAREMGLVQRVVPREKLGEAGEELLSSLREKSPVALRLAKKALRLGHARALEALSDIEAIYREELAATDDMTEGLRAFLEKRKPRFQGK